ncbi:MAG: DUF4242 domain-containing protein [Acidobacteria bacterium]|nr:DUF4242 domain-containing protein [Acidobacteriota bacterium]
MPRFIACHTVKEISREALEQVSAASQQDPDVHGVASWSNLSEGILHCVFDAPSREALAAWFDKMKIPYDRITQVQVEGQAGVLRDV